MVQPDRARLLKEPARVYAPGLRQHGRVLASLRRRRRRRWCIQEHHAGWRAGQRIPREGRRSASLRARVGQERRPDRTGRRHGRRVHPRPQHPGRVRHRDVGVVPPADHGRGAVPSCKPVRGRCERAGRVELPDLPLRRTESATICMFGTSPSSTFRRH